VTQDEAGVKVLIRYLEEEKEVLLLRASLETLAGMGTKARPAVPAVVKTLRHPEYRVRVEAARTLLDLDANSDAAVRALTAALTSKDAEARAYTAKIIGEIVNPPLAWPSCWGPAPRPRVFRSGLGKQALPHLLEALRDREGEVRQGAAASLGRIGADARAAVPALLDLLRDREPAVRRAAAEAAQGIVVDAAVQAGIEEFRALNLRFWFR
jgi:HEAT repeat protein